MSNSLGQVASPPVPVLHVPFLLERGNKSIRHACTEGKQKPTFQSPGYDSSSLSSQILCHAQGTWGTSAKAAPPTILSSKLTFSMKPFQRKGALTCSGGYNG